MCRRSDSLKNVEICHLHQEGAAEYKDPKYASSFKINNMFTGANLRKAVQEGRAGYIPIMLHEVPLLFKVWESHPLLLPDNIFDSSDVFPFDST